MQVKDVTLSAELMTRVCAFVMYYMRENMFLPGKVES
jgi:hypothetical protein